MTTRHDTAIVQLKARMREPLRARLEAAAKRQGVTLNSEMVERLELSFDKEDSFGGPEMLNLARLLTTAFIRGGQELAHSKKRPGNPAAWINDPECFGAAARAVARALAAAHPQQELPLFKAATLGVHREVNREKSAKESRRAKKVRSNKGES